MLVIAVATIAIMGGLLPESTAIGPVSPASLAIVAFFLLGMLGLNRARRRAAWRLAGAAPPTAARPPNALEKAGTGRALALFGVASAATLVAGVLLEQSGNALADVALLTAVPG